MRGPSHKMFATCLSLGLLVTGCIHPAGPTIEAAEVFVLEYRIVDLRPGGDGKMASAGHHCRDVAKDADGLTVWLWPGEERPDGPWVAVFPELPPGWTSGWGSEPYKTTFPHLVNPNVEDDPTHLGVLSWEPHGQNGTLRIDDKAVALPHSWRVTGQDGTWRAEADLYAWDREVKIDRYTGFCD